MAAYTHPSHGRGYWLDRPLLNVLVATLAHPVLRTWLWPDFTWRDKENALQNFILGDLENFLGDID